MSLLTQYLLFSLLHLVLCSDARQTLKFVAAPYDKICDHSSTKIVPIQDVSRYQAVQFLVLHDLKSRAEVKSFNFTYQEFYNHVFEAFSLIDDHSNLSVAAVDSKSGKVVGINLVLRYPQLSNMYAPTAIYEVSFVCVRISVSKVTIVIV